LRVLRVIAFTLLIVALADPIVQRPEEKTVRQGIAIEMLVDISSSMDCTISGAGEKRQTRMEAAKDAVAHFVAARENDLIGLITFARYADTVSPLTFGHKALRQLVDNLEIQDRPNEDGTAYGDALMQACAQLQGMHEWREDGSEEALIKSKVIVLLTDGENNCGRHLPQEAAGLAEKWGIRIYAISLGESDESGTLTDAEALLAGVAERSGGSFWKINDDEGLTDAYAAIDKLEKSDIVDSTVVDFQPTHVFRWFLVPSVFLLVTDMLLCATLLRVNQEVA
jgi:Ca-activated chloride channel family protein